MRVSHRDPRAQQVHPDRMTGAAHEQPGQDPQGHEVQGPADQQAQEVFHQGGCHRRLFPFSGEVFTAAVPLRVAPLSQPQEPRWWTQYRW